ncbi:MAG: hypothetical protein HDR25_05425 [Lachnospiraceae bacterium]|nr:hypothetical protein [Lachnospiraceae bacterium]
MISVKKAIAIVLIVAVGMNTNCINAQAESSTILEVEEATPITEAALQEYSTEKNTEEKSYSKFEEEETVYIESNSKIQETEYFSETELESPIKVQEVPEIFSQEINENADVVDNLEGTTEEGLLLNENIKCSNISEALSLIDENSENVIQLLGNIKEESTINIPSGVNISIDLNGFDLKISDVSVGFINNGNLEIKGKGVISLLSNSGLYEVSVIQNNSNGVLKIFDCTLNVQESVSTTGSNIATLNVYGIDNKGTCFIKGTAMDLSATCTSRSAIASLQCYGVYNNSGSSVVEEFKPTIFGKAATGTSAYYATSSVAGIYCNGGEVDYLSGNMSIVSISTSYLYANSFAVYNRKGTINIGEDDDIINEQPSFTEHGIYTAPGAVTNVYDGTYNSNSFMSGLDNNSGEVNNYINYEIEFYDDNTLLKKVTCKMGNSIAEEIDNPVKKGFVFENWKTQLGNYFNPKSKCYSSNKVYAVWKPIAIEKIDFSLPEIYIDKYADTMHYLAIDENESANISEYVIYSPEEYGADDGLLWGTSDKETADINDEGIVKGLSAGIVIISVVLQENPDITDFVAIEVKHIWEDNYVIDKQPTCVEIGKESIHCAVCNDIKEGSSREISALGHTLEIDEGILPTCTESGKTEGSHCSICNTILEAQKEIPAKGHTIVIDQSVEPTYTESGKTEGSHCSVCGIILKVQEEIPKLRHKVSFETLCGLEVAEQAVLEGEKVQKPEDVTKENYSLNGWYISLYRQDETTKWDFENDIVTKDMVLYAGWDFIPDWSGHPIDADDIEVSLKKAADVNMIYTGSYIKPEITVKYITGNKKLLLKENSDYILKYENNLQVGSSKIIVYGTGEFSGSRELDFTIKEKNIDKVKIAPIPDFMVSDNLIDNVGNAMHVMDDTKLLVYGEDFDIRLSQLEVSSPTKVTVTIIGKGNYTGTKSKGTTFLLSPYSTEYKDIEKTCNARLSANKALIFTGKALKPSIIVMEGNQKLSSKNYKIVYKDNVEAGTGYAIIYGYNGYYGSITVPFTIEPKEIGKCKLQVKNTTLYYNGREQKYLYVTVKDGKRVLKEDVDYTITYVGDFKSLTGKIKPYIEIHAIAGGNYKESTKVLSKNFKIVKGRLNSTASIEATLVGEGISYDSISKTYKVPVGAEPKVVVTYNKELLNGQKYVKKMNTSGLNYTYNFSDIKAGKKATIKVSGVNDFSGSISIKCIGY